MAKALGPTIPGTFLTRAFRLLRLISYGRSNAEVAAHLKIGPETVKHHVKQAMRNSKHAIAFKPSPQRSDMA
jgi:DNA-binding NarL/FixJ family response regulator